MSHTPLPCARAGLHTQAHDQALTVTDPVSGQTWRLDGFHAQVWSRLDAGLDAQAMTAQLAQAGLRVSAEQLWGALDALADLGLMAGRATPPAEERVSLHRPIGRRAMAFMGLAAAAAPMAFAATVADEQKAKVDSVAKEEELKAAPPADASMTADKRKMQEQEKKAQASSSRVQEADQKKNARAAEQTNKQSARAAEAAKKTQ
jgi:hypothetical protein